MEGGVGVLETEAAADEAMDLQCGGCMLVEAKEEVKTLLTTPLEVDVGAG